jgi:hypothetical protein
MNFRAFIQGLCVGIHPSLLILTFIISLKLVLSVREPSEASGVRHIINGNDRESPPAIYYGGGTQYVYTREHGDEVIKSFGVVKRDIVLNIKVCHVMYPYVL